MKNILFIRESSYYGGGIEGKIIAISKYLSENNLFMPMLATLDDKSMFAKKFREMGFEVYQIPMRGPNGINQSVDIISKLVTGHDIPVIQSHMFRESIIGRRVKKKFPLIKHIFRVHTHIEGSDIPLWRRYAYHWLDHFTANGVDLFVPISDAVRDELVKKSRIPPERIKVVYNGVPPLGEPDIPCDSAQPLTPAVAIIGDLQERKQQLLAVQAVSILRDKGLKIKIYLIGSERDDYSFKIREFSKGNGLEDLVFIYGYKNKEEIYRIIKDIPVVMLPSKFEGMPTSIIEGMSLRKLVVTTPVGGTKELVEDGVNGFLHQPCDVVALTNILEKIFTSPAKNWEHIRNNGYKTWQKKFTFESMMKGFVKIYKELGLAASVR